MIRTLIVAVLGLAAAACNVALPSAVDAAPFKARMTSPPFPDGVYCRLQKDEDGALRVASDEGNHCSRIVWDAGARLYRMDREENTASTAPVDLGDGLFLLQYGADDENSENSFARYTLSAASADGTALATIPIINDERIKNFAAKYPGISLGSYKEGHGDPAEPPPIRYYVAAGEPEDIQALVRDVALWSIGEMIQSAEEEGVELVAFIPLGVRAAPGAPNHVPTQEQQWDVEALLARLRALAE